MKKNAKNTTKTERETMFEIVLDHSNSELNKIIKDKLNYRLPPGYISQNVLVQMSVSAVIMTTDIEDKNIPNDLAYYLHFSAFFRVWLEARGPIYCLTREITEAFLATNALQKSDILKNLKFALPNILIAIPIGAITPPLEVMESLDYIDSLVVNCYQSNKDYPSQLVGISGLSKNGYVWTVKTEIDPNGFIIKYQYDGEKEEKFANKLRNLVLNILFLLNSSDSTFVSDVLPSETISEFAQSKGFGKKNNIPSPKYPRWIGKNYKIKSERSPTAENGTHSSPRTHWRRGHWRCIEPGEDKRWKESKQLWIEPVLINAGVE